MKRAVITKNTDRADKKPFIKACDIKARRLTGVLLVICLLICLTSCGDVSEMQSDETTSVTETTTVADETTSEEEATEADEATADETTTAEEAVTDKTAAKKKSETLLLDKEYVSHNDLQEGYAEMLVRSRYSNITVDENYEEQYPQLAKALKENSAMRQKAMEAERENFTALAKEKFSEDPDGFETQISYMDTVVRRADSVAVSIIEDYTSDGPRSVSGYNFDTESGNLLSLSDVITDYRKVPEIAQRVLLSRIGEEGTGDTAVVNYFENHEEKDISWSLEYNGITLWFNPGDIAPTNFSVQCITITFTEYPDLFKEKYTAVPDSYTVGLPVGTLLFTDITGDTEAEEISVTGDYDEESRIYTSLSADLGSSHYEAECSAYAINPYYVKAADGSSYLYAFVEEAEEEDRQMALNIFSLKNGRIKKLSEENMGLLYRGDNIFALPTNPEKLLLKDYEGRYPSLEFCVGENGKPQMKDNPEFG